MLENCFENVKQKKPLLHCITNYVTVNDVANAILACGASPIMSDEVNDVSDIISICDALYLNIGTLNQRSIEAMLLAGKRARDMGKLILLDPVGAGATTLRTDTAAEILKTLKPDIIRGNISEIKTLAGTDAATRGVDASLSDAITDANLDSGIAFVKSFAKAAGSVVAVTGQIDLVSDGNDCYVIRNGCSEMSRITGTGCMLSALCACYAAANPENITEATAAAVCLMGFSGEIGAARLCKGEGNASLRNHIIDAIYNANAAALGKGARYEIK